MITMLRPDDTFAPSPTSRWLVSTDWLADHLRDRNVIAVDASYFLPTQQRDANAEYRGGHISGAVFFDIEAVSDDSTELPHMLPGPAQFGEVVGSLGIGDGDTVVVYDSVGLYSAARVWWTFRLSAPLPCSPTCAWRSPAIACKSSTPARPNVSPARRPNRALICAPVTCRAHSTCPLGG
jgi:hypothetical protein